LPENRPPEVDHFESVAQVMDVGLTLEAGGEAQGDTPRRSDGVAGKKTSEVDHVKNVRQVLPVDLKAHISSLPADQVWLLLRRGWLSEMRSGN